MRKALVIGAGVAGPAAATVPRAAGLGRRALRSGHRARPVRRPVPQRRDERPGSSRPARPARPARADGHRAPPMVMRSRTGRVLGTVPNGPAGDLERGSVIVRRGGLHEVLREGAAAAGVPCTFGARLVSIDETPTLGAGHFRGRARRRGRHPDRRRRNRSRPRAVDRPLGTRTAIQRPRRHRRLRARSRLEPTPDTQHFVFGARSFFGYLVRDDGTVYWFANMTETAAGARFPRGVSGAEWLARLRDLHSDDPFPVPQILENVTGEVGAYPIFDLAGVRSWSRGRVVAIGDAVHATSPSSGQGASLALEDAITLAMCLRDLPDPRPPSPSTSALRRPRAEAVVSTRERSTRGSG